MMTATANKSLDVRQKQLLFKILPPLFGVARIRFLPTSTPPFGVSWFTIGLAAIQGAYPNRRLLRNGWTFATNRIFHTLFRLKKA